MTQTVGNDLQFSPEKIAARTEELLTEIRSLLERLRVPDLEAVRYQELIERVALLSIEVTQFVMHRLRAHIRLHLRYPVRILGTDAAGVPFTAETFTEDLSQGGACITLDREVKQGQTLALFAKDHPERGAVAALVRWAVSQDSRWRVGVKFLTPARDPLANLSPKPDENQKQGNASTEAKTAQSLENQNAEEKLLEPTLLKTGFVHLLVHDLKGPLAAIQGVLETLELEMSGRGIKDELISDLLTAGVESCQTILRLVTDLLDLAKFDSQGIIVRRVPTDLNEITQAALAEVHALALQKQITLVEPKAQDLPSILADGKLLTRALVNLLTNAIKFTDSGGRVELEARVVEGRRVDIGRRFLVLSVTDTGEGMAPEDVPYAFDLYWQSVSGKARGGGTGLGLAMVKRIAAEHGGNVSVRSQLGVGSTFAIVLPVS